MKTHQIIPGATSRALGSVDHGSVYVAPGLLVTDWVHLHRRGKRVFVPELAALVKRALN